MKKSLFFLFLMLPFLPSCTRHPDHPATAAVELDQGRRWKANPETTSGIAAMQTILAGYEDRIGDASARKALSDDLETAFENILKQCTMTGPAHDQLHNYLMPMQPLFQKIGSGGQAEAGQAAAELQEYLATYTNYFE
jgi:hypothetical protein